jgi:AraC-like DNA-binding protein
MALIAAGLSGAIVAMALLLALLLWRARRAAGQAATGLAALLLVLAALELATGPIAEALPPPLARALALAGTPNLALIWLCAHALLIDGFAPRWSHWLGAAIFWAGPLLVWAGADRGGLELVTGVLPFAMLTHLVWLALTGRRDDLVPGRRRFRLAVPALLLAAALVSLLTELLSDRGLADVLRTMLSGLPAMALFSLWLLRADAGALGFAPTVQPAPPAPAIDPRDADLARRLDAAMVHERLWQREGLSIDQLAAHLSTPPHRLRTLINGGLGQRNFAGFINYYRVKAAQAALADPARGRETILAIAYAAGFASLATFNRVFRDVVGETPTDYRSRTLRNFENRDGFSNTDEKPAAESA